MIVVNVHILEYTDLLMNSNASKISQIWTKSEHGQSLGFVYVIVLFGRYVGMQGLFGSGETSTLRKNLSWFTTETILSLLAF